MRSLEPSQAAPPSRDGVRAGRAPIGALLVVGGHSRGVGKTATIEEIIRHHSGRPWVGVKISAHRHAASFETAPLIEQDRAAVPETQTGRYLLAGAAQAFLCRTTAPQLAATAGFIRRLCADGFNVVAESNRIVDFVEPDVVVFVVAPRIVDWKASSGVILPRLHAFVIRDPGEAAAREVVGALTDKGRTAFAPGHGDETERLQRWLAGRMAALRSDPRSHAVH